MIVCDNIKTNNIFCSLKHPHINAVINSLSEMSVTKDMLVSLILE